MGRGYSCRNFDKQGGYKNMKFGNQIHSFKEQIKRERCPKWYYTVSIMMVVIVFFCTVYALILPAITLEKNNEILNCQLKVHQHTEECHDENGTLICGQADFVIHTHNETCYNADGELVCSLPEITAHEHNDDCYEAQQILICIDESHTHGEDCYKTHKKLVCKETLVQHIHDDTCYDENGMLTCGMLQLTEHIHSTVCFLTAEETATTDTTDTTNDVITETGTANDIMTETDTTNDVTTGTDTTNDVMTETNTTNDVMTETDTTNDIMIETNTVNDVMTMADMANAMDWGYNDDGSIWWNGASLQQITNSDIEENMPYIIAGNTRINVLTNTPADSTKMETKKPDVNNVGTYKDYQIWRFERFEESKDKYRIYDRTGQYLKLENTALSLTNVEEATVFTVKQAINAENNQCVMIESNGYYLNTYGSDSHCNGWAGWNDDDSGSWLQILKLTSEQKTSKTINTVSSPNTVINLFDYWVSDNQYDPDNVDADLESGINQGHALKFVHGDQNGTSDINKWTGSRQNPRQGIVQNKLDNRYPVLSGSYQESETLGEPLKESLEYLFNPTYDHPGKKSYRNVIGLLSIDNEGYYSFDSKTNAAEFNNEEDSNRFNIYDTPNVNGQFFPFNKAPEVMTLTREHEKINHYFGATITTRFIQQHGGYTDERHTTQTTFEFSGDDDVWIFIDDVLVGDVGGIHDKASVNINFYTGEVEVVVIGGSHPLRTTLKKCYEDAGKYNPNDWVYDNNTGFTTYKDNTVHTLKFFYLERGNYDSDMQLKYNLTAVPQTAIYKVDQYGEAVPEATFAVYAADENYNMLDSVNGNSVSSNDSSYDESGNLVDSAGNIIANALYTGTTNQNGEMLFADQDGMPYSINELQSMFGTHFILREIKVPDGYRVVTKDVHLQIWQGDSQKILRCVNTEKSGSRAASNMQITATDILYLQNPYNKDQYSVRYCNEKGETFGTLFAVVFRYVGAVDKDGNATEVNDSSKWVPVYGNDKDGYNMVDMTGKTWLKGVLEAAREAQNYGDIIFKLSSRGTMQLTLKNLPGHITTYYHMLPQNQKSQARYTVAYYWTDCDSLDKATEDNIHRVYTFSGSVPNGGAYSGFERVFGADIHVPNLINKVFVQKVDEKNKLIDGATFAIYSVKQLEDGTIQYLADDGDYYTLSKDVVVSPDGIITDTEKNICISPLKTDVTKTYEDKIHTGTAKFTNLSDGQYIIKEVNPPPGYKVNTADVMVLVTDDTIYANAGTENDGVTVGRGPGYLVTPLSQFASEGQIDNTLTWIYAQMRISEESTSFADVEDVNKIKGYISKNYTSETTDDVTKAFKTYLIYAEENAEMAFNYVPDHDRNEGKDSDGYRRIFTTVGWPYYEIWQHYDYGSQKANGANYENWSNHQLTNLFSRSTYIRIMDEHEPALKVKKVDVANTNTVLAEAEFRLYKMQNFEDGTEPKLLYYCWDSDTRTISWSENADDAFIVITSEDGMADNNFIGLADGEYYLEEVKPPSGYCKLNEPVKLIFKESKLTLDSEKLHDEQSAEVDNGISDEDNSYTYTVIVYNYAGFELPATGGSGTTLYTTGGFLLISVSLVYMYRKNRKSKMVMK